MTGIYPSLPGLGFSVFKEPQFKTRIQKAVSGRELRLAYQPIPTWLFKLKYEFLRDKSDQRQGTWGTTLNELRTLVDFFVAQQGSLTPFLFDDPTDDTAIGIGAAPTGTMLPAPDGANTAFQLNRSYLGSVGGASEPIIAPKAVTGAFVNGVDPGGWSVNLGTGIITFAAAPAGGTTLTWTGTYYFLTRFADDTISLEYFLYQLWSLNEVKLQSILL